MTIRDMIALLTQFAAQDLKGADAEVVLWDRTSQVELQVRPDNDQYDFEVLRGDGQVVIEFN